MAQKKGGCKPVDREKFMAAVQYLIEGGLQCRKRKKKAAEMCGLSVPTFWMRANQAVDPQKYGELPKGFFAGENGTWATYKRKDCE